MTDTKSFLSANDIADMLHISVRKAKAFLRADSVPSFKIGTTWLIEKSKLTEYLETNKNINLGSW